MDDEGWPDAARNVADAQEHEERVARQPFPSQPDLHQSTAPWVSAPDAASASCLSASPNQPESAGSLELISWV